MGAFLGVTKLLLAGLRISRTGFRPGWLRCMFPGHSFLLRRSALGFVWFALFGAGTGRLGTLRTRRLFTRLTLVLLVLGLLGAIGLKIEILRNQPATAGES